MAPPSLSTVRGVSPTNLSRSGLLVRRLGRGVGSSLRFSNRFWPLGSRTERSLSTPESFLPSVRASSTSSSLVGRNVSVFCDNSTAVSYLCKEGGTRSPFLNSLTQGILRWTESLSIRLVPQFIPGSLNVLADSLSLSPSPATAYRVAPSSGGFSVLSRQWPVQIDLFATSDNRRCSIYFSPFRDPMAAGTDAFLQRWDGLQAYAFPPWSIIPRVLAKLRSSPWWLRIGLSEPGLPTFFTCRWPLWLLFLFVKTSCACLGLAAFTRVSTGYAFRPGDSQALHESCRILILGNLSGFLVA